MVRILVADDHPALRAGLCSWLNSVDDFRVVGEASNGKETLELSRRVDADVLLLDMALPDLDGAKVIRSLAAEACLIRVLPYSGFDDYEYVRRAVDAGASGYLLKDATWPETEDAIRTVAAGGTYFSEEAASSIESLPARRSLRLIDVEAIIKRRLDAEAAKLDESWPWDVREFHGYLCEHATEEGIQIGQLLDEHRIAHGGFSAKYRRHVGLTPKRHLAFVRLTIAHEMLAAGARPSDVAFEIGYASVAAFSMAYKRIIGYPPSGCSQAVQQGVTQVSTLRLPPLQFSIIEKAACPCHQAAQCLGTCTNEECCELGVEEGWSCLVC